MNSQSKLHNTWIFEHWAYVGKCNLNQYSQLEGICMTAWLCWAPKQRKVRKARGRWEERCPLLQTCCCCMRAIAHCPIKAPPAHRKCTQRQFQTHTQSAHTHKLQPSTCLLVCLILKTVALFHMLLVRLDPCPFSFVIRSTPCCTSPV